MASNFLIKLCAGPVQRHILKEKKRPMSGGIWTHELTIMRNVLYHCVTTTDQSHGQFKLWHIYFVNWKRSSNCWRDLFYTKINHQKEKIVIKTYLDSKNNSDETFSPWCLRMCWSRLLRTPNFILQIEHSRFLTCSCTSLMCNLKNIDHLSK